ncbi:MAG TPA: hypothetical protein VEX62_09380 [Candidatus Limnocylindrales bacterium]|nr:hypothetical protein [Candidatus Limnocylindrales bacterium]
MTPLLMAREVTARSAWLSVLWPSGSPPQVAEVRGGPAPVPIPLAPTPVPGSFGPPAAWHQRMELTGLSPASDYQLVLTESGTPVAECRVRTLPEGLPAINAPLNVLLASCYSRERDPTGAVGRAFLRLPPASRPSLAVLTGDQVYLDTPIAHFLFRPHTGEQLATEFATNYAATFGQRFPDGGFGALVSSVATLMTGDDHELWNNAPNVAVHLPDTWTPFGRDAWSTLARQLYDAYQTPRRVHALEIPPLSARIVDTRFSRSADRTQIVDPQTMAELVSWLAGLTGPALLALGQPILVPTTGFVGHFTDWALADYAQYAELALALTNVNHDVVLVTGDVHFGRVAEVQLPNGRRIVEIVSSPMALVDDRAGRNWRSPPSIFPARSIPGVVSAPVSVQPFQTVENHLATLALWAEGTSVRLEHTCWLIGADGSQPQPVPGYSGRLH